MVKTACFLCLLALLVIPVNALAQDQGNGTVVIEGTLSYEGPPDDDDAEVTTTIVTRFDRSSAFPRSQLPTSQLPKSQLPKSSAFPVGP